MFLERLTMTFVIVVICFITGGFVISSLPDQVVTRGTMAIIMVIVSALVAYYFIGKLLLAKKCVELFISQEIVDQKISALAIEFHRATKEESALAHKIASQTQEDPQLNVEFVMKKEVTAKIKNIFWKTLMVAAENGFEVKSSFKEYLAKKVA